MTQNTAICSVKGSSGACACPQMRTFAGSPPLVALSTFSLSSKSRTSANALPMSIFLLHIVQSVQDDICLVKKDRVSTGCRPKAPRRRRSIPVSHGQVRSTSVTPTLSLWWVPTVVMGCVFCTATAPKQNRGLATKIHLFCDSYDIRIPPCQNTIIYGLQGYVSP